MPRRTEIQRFLTQGWPEGWRPDLQKTGAPPQSVFDILNFVWNNDMTLSKRGGYTQLADITGVTDADFVLAPRVYTTEGLFPQFTQQVLYFQRDDGEMYYQSLGKLWQEHEDAGNGDDLTDSTHSIGENFDTAINRFRTWPISAVTFGDHIYITSLRFGGYDGNTTTGDEESGDWQTQNGNFSGASLPIIYDVQNTTFDRPAVHALDGTDGGFVRARSMIAKYARIFAANIHSQGTYRYPSRIYWCGTDDDPDQPELWEALSYIDVGADDGQEIVALLSFGDQILVIKNQSIWTLVGTDSSTFALYQLDDKLGSEGTYANAATAGVAFFLDERTGVWQYDGSNFENISRPINEEILGNLNRDAAFKSVMTIHNNTLYVSIPTGTGSDAVQEETYVWDMELQVWTKFDYGIVPSAFPFYSDLNVTGPNVSMSNELFAGRPDEGVYILNDGTSDDGTDIECRVTTPWLAPGDMADSHRLRRLELVTDPGDGDATIDVFTDLDFSSAETTLTHSVSGTTENYLSEYQRLDDYLWTWLCLRVTQDSSTALNLYALGFSMSDRPRPRGTLTGTGYTA